MPIEFSNRILDLFWIFDEKFLIDSIIHLLRMRKQKLKRMNMEVILFNIGIMSLFKTRLG